jgi:CRISPR/Cas system CSM-associated protein Csm2 small subunit
MGKPLQCFAIEELEELDESQLRLLRKAIEREIRTNADIQKIIRDKFAPMRVRMAAQRRRGSGPAQGA